MSPLRVWTSGTWGHHRTDRHSLAPGGKYGTEMTGQQIYSRLAGVPYPNGMCGFDRLVYPKQKTIR